MKNVQRVISLLLMLSMLVGFFPSDTLRATARAEAPDPTIVEAKSFSDMPEQAAELAGQGAALTENGWRYVPIPDTDYAAVMGYTDTSASVLEMPDVLGGLDVVAVAPGALADVSRLEKITVPGNVRAIGDGAFARGTSVEAVNASYAAGWATENHYPYMNASELEFREGVVDLSDIRTDNFVRLSETEVWLRSLEATRLKKGSFFFLVDPANAYQISYYKVTAITDMQNGFIRFTCETPEVESILLHYEAVNEALVADLSSIELYDGASLENADEIAASSTIGGSASGLVSPLNLKVKKDFDIGSHGQFSIDGSFSKTYSISGEVGLFTPWKITMKEEESLKFSASLSVSGDLYANEQDTLKQYGKDFISGTKGVSNLALMDRLRSFAKGSKSGEDYQMDIPVANVMLFSWAGIVNVTGSVFFTAELSGEVSFEYESTSTTTTVFEKGQNPSKSVKPGVKKVTGEVKVELKIGLDVGINLCLGPVQIAAVSAFVGLKASASFDLEYKFGKDGERGTNEFELFFTSFANMGNDIIQLPDEIDLNQLDCVEIKVSFVVELALSLGIGKAAQIASARATVVDLNIISAHWHLFPYVYRIEDYTDDWDEKEFYLYYKVGEKDRLHMDVDCSYEQKTVTVHYPHPTQDKTVSEREKVDPGFTYGKPYLKTTVLEKHKLLGWYTDKSFTADQRVKSWPYQILNDTDFYARTVPYHRVHFVNSDGKYLNYPSMYCAAIALNNENAIVRNYDYNTSWNGKLAEGEAFELPETDPNGERIENWIQVVSATNRTPIATESDSEEAILETGTLFEIMEDRPKDIYLCAITDKDVVASFFTGVGNHSITVCGKRGDVLTVPECNDTWPRYDFVGWVDEDGNPVSGSIQTDETTKSKLHYYAVWEPNGEITTIPVSSTYIGTSGTNYSDTTPDDPTLAFSYSYDSGSGTATITGLRNGFNPEHLRIPSQIGDYTVTAIGTEAFKNNTTLISITLPGSVRSLGSSVFYGCTNLRLIDLSATKLTELPASFAYGCTRLARVLIPNSTSIGRIGNSAFCNCKALDKLSISTEFGSHAFEGCSGLTEVKIEGSSVLGYGAFMNCTGLTSFAVPDSVTSLGTFVLSGCTNITELMMEPSVSALTAGQMTIGMNSKLRKLVLGGTIQTLEERCLSNESAGFTMLTDVTLPEQLKQVGSDILQGSAVSKLTVSFATLDAVLSNGAFRGMDSLEEVYIISGYVPNDAFSENSNLKKVRIGSFVHGIRANAFQNCSSLETVVFDEDSQLYTIGNSAFQGCSSLTEIELPESLMNIDAYAFRNCSSLTSLEIPDSVTSCGQRIIEGCSALKYLRVGAGLDSIVSSNRNHRSRRLCFFQLRLL